MFVIFEGEYGFHRGRLVTNVVLMGSRLMKMFFRKSLTTPYSSACADGDEVDVIVVQLQQQQLHEFAGAVAAYSAGQTGG